MKVLSLNIRGIQDRPKHAKLWSLIRVEGVVMCFFQKTKCSMLFEGIHLYVNDSNFGQVWDSCSKHAFESYNILRRS